MPYGGVFHIEYEVLPPIDMYARNDINNSTMHEDGSLYYVNDGDDWVNRIGQHQTETVDLPEMFAPSNEWTTMSMMYRNKNNVLKNPDGLPLLDSTIFGLHNPTDEPVTIQLRNVKVSIY